VNLTLTDEQRLLAETARAFVERRRAADDDVDPWPTIVDAGWPGLLVPEHHGGAGVGLMEVALVCEALGRGPVPSPLVASGVLAALLVLMLGSDEQRERLLAEIAAGTAVATLALLEPGMRDEWDPPRIEGSPRVAGTKILVPWAAVAEVLVVATADGLRVVEADAQGVTFEEHDALGAEPSAAVTFHDTRSDALGAPSELRLALDHVMDFALVASSAFAVGAADAATELSVAHARDREQFGRPIGSFQAVAHRCAEMRADVDASRYLTYRAAWALDRSLAGGAREVATAASYAKDAVRRVFLHAHQVHGAMGFTTEHELHRFTQVAKAFELSYGSAARHRDRLASTIGLGARR
jgi:alkylation response protein AidB-like acyl-CoA dehydrogenase